MLEKRGWGVGGATARVRTPMQFGFAFDFRFCFCFSDVVNSGKRKIANGVWQFWPQIERVHSYLY